MPRFNFASLASFAFGTAASLLATPVLANGRFPAANQLVVDPGDPSHVVVRTTFGVLQTTDGGATWRWVCEKALGFEGTYDPAVAVAGDGSILVGLPDGAARSSDRACTFPRIGDPLAKKWVVDLSVDLASPKRAVAITTPVDTSTPGFQETFAESLDNGATWKSVSLLPEDFVPETVDVTKSDPKRVYVSGVGPFKRFAIVLRSTDGGATFTETTFDMTPARKPYIAGVDPTNADRLYVRLDGDDEDRLVFSGNGGSSFSDLLKLPQLLGFALSPDGTKVATGGPGGGLHVAPTSSHSFKKVNGIGVRCLAWTTAGLYACGDDATDGFTVGLSTDDGATFKPLLKLAALGPLSCPAGTVTQDVCSKEWPALKETLNPSKPDGGVGDAATDAAPPSDGGAPPATPPGDSGCGCRFAASSGAGAFVALAFAAATVARRRRR